MMAYQLGGDLLSIKLWVAVLAIVLLSACTLKTEVPPVNPNPTDEIIIYGSLPADQALDVQMTARFESKSKFCGNYVDISHVYQLSETLKIHIEKTANQYQARFFRDALSKGRCDWSLIYVTAELTHKDAGSDTHIFYNATPKDLATKHYANVMHNEEDYLLEVECDVKPSNPSNSNSEGEASAQKGLDCSNGRGMFLMPEIHKYHVNYDYTERGIF